MRYDKNQHPGNFSHQKSKDGGPMKNSMQVHIYLIIPRCGHNELVCCLEEICITNRGNYFLHIPGVTGIFHAELVVLFIHRED
jgi:hypothetical protein